MGRSSHAAARARRFVACLSLVAPPLAACGAEDSATPGAAGGDGGAPSAGGGDGAAPLGGDGAAPLGGDAGPSFDAGPPLPTCDPGGAVRFAIDATAGAHPISPYVYGTNLEDWGGVAKHLTLGRAGGNRWTAYNWETNASNSGDDLTTFQNDSYLGGGATAGEAVRSRVAAALGAGVSFLVTVPIQGWVAKDESGPVDTSGDPSLRFLPIVMNKGAAAAYPPDLGDGKVYVDEMVAFVEGKFPQAHADPKRSIFYELDNEPDLWATTHKEIQKTPITYASLLAKSTEAATMIKRVAPQALVFGPVSYGWSGFVNLQAASDANNRDWLDTYLETMKAAEQKAGHRVFDVLDVHWYPEVAASGVRVIVDQSPPTADVVAARLQAPRSLWDPSYVEPSWITSSNGGKAIRLLPLLREKIAAHYPGTKIAITEYHYGQGDDISGGIAQADVLGAFGREGLFAATHWPLSKKIAFVYAAFAMFRDYDGAGGAFGDLSIAATTSDVASSSVYASVDTATGHVVVVALNKTTAPLDVGATLRYGAKLTHVDAWQLTSAQAKPVAATPPTIDCQAFRATLPPRSVTTYVLR